MTKDDDFDDLFRREIANLFKQAGLGAPKISGFTMTFDSEHGWQFSNQFGEQPLQPTVEPQTTPTCDCKKAPKVEIIETDSKYNLTMDVGELTENDIKIYPLSTAVIVETPAWRKEVPLTHPISQKKVESTLANGVLDIDLVKVK